MITETTKRCSVCATVLDGVEHKCPRCGTEQCVPIAEWPAGARKFLYLLVITDILAIKLGASEQTQLEFLLENAIRGRYYDGKLITRAASASHCYPQFLTLFERWQAQGSPTDFVALGLLRGTR